MDLKISGDVSTIFEMLLEKLDAEISAVNTKAASATEMRQYDSAKKAINHAERIVHLREKLSGLYDELNKSTRGFLEEESEKEGIGAGKSIIARLPKGKRTPEKAFYVPILQAIVEMGGSASMGSVLPRVHELIHGSLKEADKETLSSAPTTPRWRNTAQWARNSLVKEGLMSSDSPHGVWAITQRGKEFLKTQ